MAAIITVAAASSHLSFLRNADPLPRSPTAPTFNKKRTRPHHRQLTCCLAVDRENQEDLSAAATRPPPPPQPQPGTDLRVLFAGGGSGGHVYPAIAIADDLRNLYPESRVLFVGSAAGLESVAVPAAGYDFVAVPPARLSRPLYALHNLLLPCPLFFSIAASWKILREFRPQIVVGTGGYVAAPVCFAAVLSGIKIAIQEQNSSPGLTNRMLAPFAQRVFLAFNACVKHFPKHKCLVYGNPVRQSLRRYVSKAVARSHFFPSAAGRDKAQVVLVLGGSQGANSINYAMLNMYYDMLKEHKNRYIIWQTGAGGYNEMECLIKNSRRLRLMPFLHEMDLAYAAADVVVSRAGAMTCTEILTTGKPSILIPSTTVADDHQTKNAYIMADVAGSKVLTEDELDASSLAIAIDEILGNQHLMEEMSRKALTAARPNAATNIAQCIRSLISLSSPK